VGTANATINGKSYTFAGTTPGSTVSVGAGGAERTLTNVAAGRLHFTRVRAASLARCLIGGVLMGWGSLLIPGGNDGLILVGMPLLWPYAWIAFATMCLTIGGAQTLQRRLARSEQTELAARAIRLDQRRAIRTSHQHDRRLLRVEQRGVGRGVEGLLGDRRGRHAGHVRRPVASGVCWAGRRAER
jgi:hypothetical protein